MIYWLRLFGLIFGVIAVIAIVGSLLPRSYDFEVTETIGASPDRIYQEMESLPKWQAWSQWSIENETVESLEHVREDVDRSFPTDPKIHMAIVLEHSTRVLLTAVVRH